ncbi:MAG TPA: LacI family DNA-binding transcriptional regulator [Chloroflexota bacterium]
MRPARTRITMADVARDAGVSTTTVSHVINGTRRVDDATRDRVLNSISTLKYHHNQVARSLATRVTGTIGVVIEEIVNPLFPPALEGVEREAAKLGYSVIACGAPDFESERRALATLQEKRVDGVILVSLSLPRKHDHLRDLRSDGVPVVAVNRYPHNPDIDFFYFDYAGGTAVATDHLLQLGRRRLAHLAGPLSGPRTRPSAVERLAGFRHALESEDLPFERRLVVESDYGYESALVAARTLLATNPLPTGVVAWNDISALAVLRAAQERGMTVPADLAVVAIGDEPFATCATPSLTAARLPAREAGILAARLIDRLVREGSIEPQCVVLPCQLVIRESCGAKLNGRSN